MQDCNPDTIDLLDNVPGVRFTPVGFQNRMMPDFDWDGFNRFVFNTSRRNNDGEIGAGANFTPIPLPEGFFKNPREAPQPALHPAQ